MGAWVRLDQLLGFVEVLAVMASTVYLIRGSRASSRHRKQSMLVAALIALTVAQPFGVKGEPITPQEFAAGVHQPADPESVHSLRVLGLPLFGFRPYTRDIFYLNGEAGYPTHWLKIRSWLWPGLLTNGAKIERLCGEVTRPCWRPRQQGHAQGLELRRAGDEWRYRLLTADGRVPQHPTVEDGVLGYSAHYRLALGVTSVPGLLYWLFVLAVALGRRARRARNVSLRTP
jgi:hypothetical protein